MRLCAIYPCILATVDFLTVCYHGFAEERYSFGLHQWHKCTHWSCCFRSGWYFWNESFFPQFIMLSFTSESGMGVYKLDFFQIKFKNLFTLEDILNFLKSSQTIATGWIWTRETSLGKNHVTLGHHIGLLNKYTFIAHH